MKVLSLSDLRSNLFKVFFLMRDTNVDFEVSYRSKVYKLSIEDTGRRLKRKYKRVGNKTRLNPLMVNVAKCPDCKGLMIANTCIDNCKVLQEAR